MSKRKNSKSCDVNKIETKSEISIGIQKLQDRETQITENIFSQMLSKSKPSSSASSAKDISTMKDYGTATSSTTPAPISVRKSSESVNLMMNVEEYASPSMTPTAAPLAELDRKKLTESMIIDNDNAYSPAADDHFKLIIPFAITMSLHLKFLILI